MSETDDVARIPLAWITHPIMILAGAVIGYSLFEREGMGSNVSAIPTKTGQVTIDDHEKIHFTLNGESNQTRNLVIHDGKGIARANFLIRPDGRFSLEPGASEYCPFILQHRPAKPTEIGVRVGEKRTVKVVIHKDGMIEMYEEDADQNIGTRVKLDAHGKVTVGSDARTGAKPLLIPAREN